MSYKEPTKYAFDYWCKEETEEGGQLTIVTLFSDGGFNHWVSVDKRPVSAPGGNSPFVVLPDCTMNQALSSVRHNLESRYKDIDLIHYEWNGPSNGYTQVTVPYKLRSRAS